MADRTEHIFFSNYWIIKNVVSEILHSSRWTIVEKLSEKTQQLLPKESWQSTRDCHTIRPRSFVKNLQFPHRGTEADPDRAQQSGKRTHGDVEAFRAFHEKQVQHVQTCLGFKEETQGPCDIIPCGYTLHLLWEKIHGMRPDEVSFWGMPYSEYANIRNTLVPTHQ